MPHSNPATSMHQQTFVVVGGGPAGLYNIIKLVKKGVHPSQIILCDARFGHYTRPGHLGKSAFDLASDGAGVAFDIDFKQGESSVYGHIKDIERALCKVVSELGITIINDNFSHLARTSDGVDINLEQVLTAPIHLTTRDFLFDCTGTRRLVVNSINEIFPQQAPFRLENIADKTCKHHFLAYVKMNEDDRLRLTSAWRHIECWGIRELDNFREKIQSLRALGWTENSMPRFYWVSFGKGKHCFYMHAPESLPIEQYDAWFQALLNLYAEDIKYEHLTPSKKHGKKPRFNYFQTSAEYLTSPCFKQENFPQVIALGDAMIDPDYYLSHGIGNGFMIINDLANHLFLDKEQAIHFDESGFKSQIKSKVEHQIFCMKLEDKVAVHKRHYFFKVASETGPDLIIQEHASSAAASSCLG